MNEVSESPSIEAQIADCAQALYRATDSDTAMFNWARLRDLVAMKAAREDALFRRETQNLVSHHADDAEKASATQVVYSSWRRRPGLQNG